MKCTFSASDPNILLEAQPGDLFVPLGPHLVECACALRSHTTADGIAVYGGQGNATDPNAMLPVVVLACRIGKGEPEHYPVGYSTWLPAASPIAFLEQVEALALRERKAAGDAGCWQVNVAAPHDVADAAALAARIRRDFEDVPVRSL